MLKPDSRSKANGVFGTTHWSVVLQAGQGGSQEAEAALARLYRSYWYPLYAYIRRQGQDWAAAQDLVQDLFVALLEKKQLAHVAPDKGRFRSFLLAAANHLLVNQWRKASRQKRGGGQAALSLDAVDAEERYRHEPVDERTPEALFNRRWALVLLEGVVDRLREEWQAAGKVEAFEVMKVFLSGEDDPPSQAVVAGRLGLSEGAARVAVHRLRQRYRELLRDEVAQTVANTADIEDELRHLLTALRD